MSACTLSCEVCRNLCGWKNYKPETEGKTPQTALLAGETVRRRVCPIAVEARKGVRRKAGKGGMSGWSSQAPVVEGNAGKFLSILPDTINQVVEMVIVRTGLDRRS